jgi:choline dehydrogenase-like flavoprotein
MASEWDRSADLVVVGFGGAGATAALAGAELGATVLILEKQPGRLRAPGRVADPAGLAALLLHAVVPGRAEHLRRPAAG